MASPAFAAYSAHAVGSVTMARAITYPLGILLPLGGSTFQCGPDLSLDIESGRLAVRRLQDGSADHEVIGTCAYRVPWRYRPRLIVHRSPPGTNTRGYDDEPIGRCLPDRSDLQTGRDDAVDAHLMGHFGPLLHQLFRALRNTLFS